jgi:uncharacterized protein (UPF0333 family)
MFKKLIKNKKAQQTAEYALLITLVVAAVIAMQTYAQRAIQGRIRDASLYMVSETSALGKSNQYEPYYLESSYETSASVDTVEMEEAGGRSVDEVSNRLRGSGGYQASDYNAERW